MIEILGSVQIQWHGTIWTCQWIWSECLFWNMGNHLLWISWTSPNPVSPPTIGRRYSSSFSSEEEFLGFGSKGRKLYMLEVIWVVGMEENGNKEMGENKTVKVEKVKWVFYLCTLSSPCVAWKVYFPWSSVLSWVFRLTINDWTGSLIIVNHDNRNESSWLTGHKTTLQSSGTERARTQMLVNSAGVENQYEVI